MWPEPLVGNFGHGRLVVDDAPVLPSCPIWPAR
jgi:hypothetical protein